MTAMGRERLVTVVNHVTSFGIDNRFLVPIVVAVDDAPKLHPFAGVSVQAIAETLFHEESPTARRTGLDPKRTPQRRSL